MPQRLTLAPFYDGWGRYNELLSRAVAPLSAEQLGRQAAPTLRPIWHLTAHIIAGRIGWFQRTLGEGDPALAAYRTWTDDGQPARSAAELVTGLAASWRLIDDCLGRWTPAMLDDPVTTPTGRQFTRQWVIWHVIEHDLHHGGELFFSLGLHGIATPDLSYRALPPTGA